MWYKELINNQNSFDGLEPLLKLFKKKERFVDHFVSSVLFFPSDIVEKQAQELQEKIKKSEALPVRFTLKSREHFHYPNDKNQKGTSSKTFKNRKDAQVFSEKNDLRHRKTTIKVKIDKDGNYYVRRNFSIRQKI